MKSREGSNLEQIGRWLGQSWRGLLQQEARLTRSLIACGMSADAAAAVGLIARLAVGGLLLCAITGMVIARWAFSVAASGAQSLEGDIPLAQDPEPTDHRDCLFYDPINYNDDPDPRFRREKGPFASPLGR